MHNSQRMYGWYRYTRGYQILGVMIALLSVVFLAFLAQSSSALTTVPTKMNFQGRLTDSSGNIKPNGTYNMKFKLYTVASAGSPVWSEDRLVSATQGVTVTNGLFSVQLGSVTSLPANLFASGALYLEVELPSPATATTSSPTWSEGPMSPRNQMATSAYAYNAETIDGIDSANLAQLDQNNTFSGNNIFTGTIQGNSSLTLGTAAAQGSLIVNDGNGQTATIRVADTAGNYVYTLPVTTANDTFCLQALANCGGGSGVTTVGALDGGTANANGATVSGTTIYLQSASATNAGLINTIAQTFAGTKTFGDIVVENNLNVMTELTVGGVTSFNSNVQLSAGSILTLAGGITSTRPALPTEGMIYYDTTTKQLLTYANGKWQADQSEAILVAAANSSQADKDSADYVANGDNVTGAGTIDGDQVQINNALTAASGKKVVLLAGTYVADATILIPNNTTLAGVGQGTVIELADIDVTDNLIENSDTTTGTGVTIKDMKLDGRKDLNTVGAQSGVYFNNMGGGLGSSARNGAVISGVTAMRMSSNGIYIANSSNNSFVNNISSANDSGYLLSSSSNNELTSNTAQGNGGIGFYLTTSSSNNQLTGNTAEGNTSYGIYVNSSSNYNTLTGNTLQNNSHGIYVSSSNSTSITGNTAINNTNSGLYMMSVNATTIVGNTAQGSANYGFYLQQSSDNIISGNMSKSNAYGFDLYEGNRNNFTGNTAQSNSAIGFTFDANVSNSTNNNVTNNIARSNGTYGFSFSLFDKGTVSGNTLFDNGGTTNNNAIRLSDSDSNNITGNTITDSSATTTNYAINISDASSATNYLADNTLGGGSVNDLGTSTVYSGQLNANGYFVFSKASARLGIGQTAPAYALDVTGDVNSTTGFRFNGTAGASVTCSGGQFLQNQVVQGGIVTGGTCAVAGGGSYVTLQGTTPGTADTGNLNITGSGLFGTAIKASTLDTITATVLNIGSTATQINLNQNVVVAAGKYIDSVGGYKINGTSGSSTTCAGGQFLQNQVISGGIVTGGTCAVAGGGGGSTRKVTLVPEYPGGIISPDGSNNTGTLTSDFDGVNVHNYYGWTNSTGSLNDYDVVVRTAIPSEYASGFGTFKIWAYAGSTSTVNNNLQVTVKDSSGTACASNVSVIPGTASTWVEQSVALSGCTFAANNLITISIKMSSLSNNAVRIGELSYQYTN